MSKLSDTENVHLNACVLTATLWCPHSERGMVQIGRRARHAYQTSLDMTLCARTGESATEEPTYRNVPSVAGSGLMTL